jgi:hypothetical protein
MRWKRERAKAGPGDTLDGRWEVCKWMGGRWRILDRQHPERRGTQVGDPLGYATMRLARYAAEVLADNAREAGK